MVRLHRKHHGCPAKKLEAVARRWASPAPAARDGGIAEQVAGLGLPAEFGERLLRQTARTAPANIEVLPDNWPAVRLFLAMGTQWRRAGMGGRATGLDYAALPVPAAAYGIAIDEDTLARLQVMEMEAVRIMAERD